MNDLVIRGGEVLDGSGAPAIRADLAIRGGTDRRPDTAMNNQR
jgi:N-acyl-D-aspartate/D-glutamate deacylase